MNAKKQKIYKEIHDRYAKEHGSKADFFKSFMRVTYKGFETRIRYDEDTKWYWSQIDNSIYAYEYLEKDYIKLIKRFKKDIDKGLENR